MALRLAGEEYSVVQGLDPQGFVREVTANDALPGLIIDQKGSGRLGEVRQSGATKVYVSNTGVLVSLSDPALRRDGVISYLGLQGSDTVGSEVDLYGESHATHAGRIRLLTPDAAKTSLVERIRLAGAADAGQSSVTIYEPLDAQQTIKNTGSANGGAVWVDDELRVTGQIAVYNPSDLNGTIRIHGKSALHAWAMLERSSHLGDTSITEDFGFIYIYNDGAGTRQLVCKYKDAGTVFTGTVSLT